MEFGKSPIDVNISFGDIAKAAGGWVLEKVKDLVTPFPTSGYSPTHHFEHPLDEPVEPVTDLGSYAEVADELRNDHPWGPPTIQPRHGTFRGW